MSFKAHNRLSTFEVYKSSNNTTGFIELHFIIQVLVSMCSVCVCVCCVCVCVCVCACLGGNKIMLTKRIIFINNLSVLRLVFCEPDQSVVSYSCDHQLEILMLSWCCANTHMHQKIEMNAYGNNEFSLHKSFAGFDTEGGGTLGFPPPWAEFPPPMIFTYTY